MTPPGAPISFTSPDTTPKEPKPNPFEDIFGHDEDEERSWSNVTDVSTILSSYPSASMMPEHSFTDEDRTGASYFNFFLAELSKCFPYVNMFPWTAATLFSRSNHNPALRQSVLAVASLIVNQSAENTEAFDHLHKALRLLRNRLSEEVFDVDGLAISTFLLAHFCILLGDHAGARKHLQGMSTVLARVNTRQSEHGKSAPQPLTMLIWRMAMRIDFISSITCGKQPVLPKSAILLKCADCSLPDEEEGFHQKWIQSNADRDISPDHADWAEAWIALDALMHRTSHAASAVNRLRSQPGSASDAQIRALMNSLTDSHHRWRDRRVIRKSDQTEKVNELFYKANLDRDGTSGQTTTSGNSPSGTSESGFLGYTPVRLYDVFFASRLNNWRAIRLHISLIQEPMWGLYDGSRFVCAVDLCRTHAALGSEKNFLGAEKAVGLYLAGVVFGGPAMYAVRKPKFSMS